MLATTTTTLEHSKTTEAVEAVEAATEAIIGLPYGDVRPLITLTTTTWQYTSLPLLLTG